MRKELGQLLQLDRNSVERLTNKQINFNQIHKQPLDNLTTIKKIKNYSYAIIDQIGIGLTSRVYKGKNDLCGNFVALKKIDLKTQKDLLANQFLNQEIQILSNIKLRNPQHLLLLETIIKTVNNLYIITEFCQGKDMGKILRQKQVLNQHQAQSVMKQMILGYKQLYSMGLIHRDLKLSNLFVTKGKIKLADFGFAISQDKCNLGFNYNVGSPKYMAPQSLKFNKYSFKSDAWSIGIMAYELVYGEVPWKNKDDAKLYQMITTIPIQKILQSNKTISEHYKKFIISCLQPNIQKRANSEYIFSYTWPIANEYIEGYQQQLKMKQIIKVPGKNYAVFNSANQVSYQSKKLVTTDFINNSTLPTQFVLLSQLNYCIFLMNISKQLKQINKQNNMLINALNQQIGLTVQIVMKILGQIVCMQKNKLDTPDFQQYVKTGDWLNLKQMIVRYDIQFRAELHSNQQLLKKGVGIPKTSILAQTISYLKTKLPQNARLLDKLLTYYQLRQIFTKSRPLQFAQKSNMLHIIKDISTPQNKQNIQLIYPRIAKKLHGYNL